MSNLQTIISSKAIFPKYNDCLESRIDDRPYHYDPNHQTS